MANHLRVRSQTLRTRILGARCIGFRSFSWPTRARCRRHSPNCITHKAVLAPRIEILVRDGPGHPLRAYHIPLSGVHDAESSSHNQVGARSPALSLYKVIGSLRFRLATVAYPRC